jgi:hypothetical protein
VLEYSQQALSTNSGTEIPLVSAACTECHAENEVNCKSCNAAWCSACQCWYEIVAACNGRCNGSSGESRKLQTRKVPDQFLQWQLCSHSYLSSEYPSAAGLCTHSSSTPLAFSDLQAYILQTCRGWCGCMRTSRWGAVCSDI